MAAVEVPSNIEEPLDKTFAVLGAILFCTIFIYHIVTTKVNSNKDFKASKVSTFLSFILFIFGLIVIFALIFELFAPSTTLCTALMFIGLPPYIIFKLFLYLILVNRLHIIFTGSNLAYSSKKLRIWAIILIIWSIINLVFVNIGLTKSYDDHKFPKCNLEANEIGLSFMALQDIVSGVINAYLFVRPIVKLKNNMMDVDTIHIQSNNYLKYIAAKQCVLSLSAIISTVLAVIGIIMVDMPAIWLSSDIVISTLSIILMYEWNDNVATKICFCCLSNHQWKKDESNKNVRNLEMTVGVNAKQIESATSQTLTK